MPEIRIVYPRDIVVGVEFTAKEIEQIHMAMQDCQFTYVGIEPKNLDARNYMIEKFYPFIDNLVEQLKIKKNNG